MHSVAHIINPFNADKSSDLYVAQPITFQSILKAKAMANDIINIELLSAQFEEDKNFVPPGFKSTKNLSQSVLDKNKFETKVKLPFIADILKRAYTESQAEYIIYSNVDIGLYPDFYIKVNDFINQGYDSFIINRRRLKAVYSKVSELDAIYKDFGKPHPGFDCFIFHRSLFTKLRLDGICIGVPFIEIAFSQNLFALSKNFKLFNQEFLTFHIGEEIFKKRTPKEYFSYNQKKFWNNVSQLWNDLDLKKIPFYSPIFPLRIIRWGLHPCVPIRLILKLEWRNLKETMKFKTN